MAHRGAREDVSVKKNLSTNLFWCQKSLGEKEIYSLDFYITFIYTGHHVDFRSGKER
jgi:hypothetical protein